MSEEVRKCPISKNRLSDAQTAAVALMVAGRSFKHVCDSLNIDARTLYRWRRRPAFRRALHAHRRDVWANASDRLRAMLDRSLDVFEEQLDERYQPTKFRAAHAVLRLADIRATVGAGKRSRRKHRG